MPSVLLFDASFGHHTFDLMALPSNVRKSQDGRSLKFFSPSTLQRFIKSERFMRKIYHVRELLRFPSIRVNWLISQIFQFPTYQSNCHRSIHFPRQYWWPLIHFLSIDSLKIGLRKQHNIINFPPNTKQGWHSRSLPWDLHAFRLCF